MRRIHWIFVILIIGCTENHYTLYESSDGTETDTDSEGDTGTGTDTETGSGPDVVGTGQDTETETDSVKDTDTDTGTETDSGPNIIITGSDSETETDSETVAVADTATEFEACLDSDDTRLAIKFKLVHVDSSVQGEYIHCSVPEGEDWEFFSYLTTGVWDGSISGMHCRRVYCDDTDDCSCVNALKW